MGRVRLYSFDEKKFDSIDSQEKAYWLGFLLGDGSISRTGTLSLELSQKDRDHIEKFLSFMNANYPIRNTRKNCCIVAFNSINFCKELERFGLIRNKTQFVKTPTECQPYLSDFYRGIFDSDGWMTKNTLKGKYRPQWQIGFSSANQNFLQEIQSWIVNHNSISSSGYLKHRKYKISGECWQFIIGGNKNILSLYDIFYKDLNHNGFLNRKKDLFDDAVSYITSYLSLPTFDLKVSKNCLP